MTLCIDPSRCNVFLSYCTLHINLFSYFRWIQFESTRMEASDVSSPGADQNPDEDTDKSNKRKTDKTLNSGLIPIRVAPDTDKAGYHPAAGKYFCRISGIRPEILLICNIEFFFRKKCNFI